MAKYKNRDVTLVEEVSDAEYSNKVKIKHEDGTLEDVKKSDVMVSLAEAAKLRNKTLGGSDPMLLPPKERKPVGSTIAEVSAKESADEKAIAHKKEIDKKHPFLNP